MPSSETALEKLLLRIVPRLSQEWEGAPASEIAQIESIAGRPLPELYVWFLSHLGRSMGGMQYPTIDFSARAILSAYAARQIEPHPRFLLIGHEHDEVSPLHYFYDLESPARADALVVRMLTPKDESHEQFETFREMLAWGELWSRRVEGAPQQCQGRLHCPGGALHAELWPVLSRLGFEAPIETGAFCGLYERSDAALICTGTPNEASDSQAFGLGGLDAGTLGKLLSTLATESSIDIRLSTWSPPLPSAS